MAFGDSLALLRGDRPSTSFTGITGPKPDSDDEDDLSSDLTSVV